MESLNKLMGYNIPLKTQKESHKTAFYFNVLDSR